MNHVALLSGGELALARLVPGIAEHHEVVVVLAEDGPLRPVLERAGARVELLPLPGWIKDTRRAEVLRPAGAARAARELARYVAALRRLLRELGADLVHTNSLKSGFYGAVAGRAARVPVVWHVRDRIAPDYLPRALVVAVRLALRVLPTLVLVNSRETAATVVAGGPWRGPAPVVVHDPYDPPEAPDASGRSAAGDVAVVMVGRLTPWKGQREVVAAFAEAFPAPSTSTLTLVGSALFGEEDYARSVAQDAALDDLGGRVRLLGQVDDVAAVLRRSDVLVHASTVPEPFGQVVVEGLAAGLPVVAPAWGGPAEVITDGVDGVLVEPNDAPALVSALRRLAAGPGERTRLGAAAVLRARDFRSAAVVPAVLDAYERVAPPGR